MLPQSPTRKLLALLLALVVCWQLFVLLPWSAPASHDALNGVIESFLAELQPLTLLPDSGRLKHGLRARLRCDLAASEPARYAGLKQQSIFVASNLVNAAFCLPSFAVMLLRMTAYLDPTRLTVSIYENDSGDATPAVLQALEKALVQAGVKNVIIQSAESDRAERHWQQRIQTMAKLRNEALRPLYENTTGVQYDSVLFLNDVFTCEADALELLYQRKLQDAEQVCATDWNYTPASGGTKLYDLWVLRGLNGNLPYLFNFLNNTYQFLTIKGFDLQTGLFSTQDKEHQIRWLRGLPVPVYSCWNGMTALRASLFTDRGLRFRAAGPPLPIGTAPSDWDRLLQTPKYLQQDCPASECSLLDRDIWNLQAKQARIAVVPRSRCAYDADAYNYISGVIPFDRTDDPAEEVVDWNWVGGPAQVLCMPGLNEWTTKPYQVGACQLVQCYIAS